MVGLEQPWLFRMVFQIMEDRQHGVEAVLKAVHLAKSRVEFDSLIFLHF